MKIKLDENIPVTAKGILANVSSDIHAVYEEGLSGADDGTL
jgi:predicted nuclease of predicted toxin-antitoxin system